MKAFKPSVLLFAVMFCLQGQAQEPGQSVNIESTEEENTNIKTFRVPEGMDVKEYMQELGIDVPDFEIPSAGATTKVVKKKVQSMGNADQPMLGIMLAQVDKNINGEESSQVLVKGIIEGSGAAAAGIEVGDVLLAMDGANIVNAEDVLAYMQSMATGDQIELVIERDGETQTVPVELKTSNELALQMEAGWEDEIEIKQEVKMKQNFQVYVVDDADIKKFMEGEDLEVEMEVDTDGETVKKMIIHRDETVKKGDCPEFKVLILEIDRFELQKITKEDEIDLAKMEEMKVEEFTIAPNPNSGDFRLSFSIDEKEETEVRVLDMSGQRIYQEDLGDFSGNYERDIELHGKASAGMYIIQVVRPKSMMSKKLIVN